MSDQRPKLPPSILGPAAGRALSGQAKLKTDLLAKLNGFGVDKGVADQSEALKRQLEEVVASLPKFGLVPDPLVQRSSPINIRPIPSQTALLKGELVQVNQTLVKIAELEKGRMELDERRDNAARRRDWRIATLVIGATIVAAVAVALLQWAFQPGSSSQSPAPQHEPPATLVG